jgi:farnesyl diphosphate synthase
MVGGQMLDLAAEGKALDEQALEDMHRRKTGELIRAAVMMPVELAVPATPLAAALDRVATEVGLLFQIRDDLLEIDHDTVTLGKSATSDRDNQKSTYPSVLGVAAARERARALYEQTLATLDDIGHDAAGLRWIVEYIHGRLS